MCTDIFHSYLRVYKIDILNTSNQYTNINIMLKCTGCYKEFYLEQYLTTMAMFLDDTSRKLYNLEMSDIIANMARRKNGSTTEP